MKLYLFLLAISSYFLSPKNAEELLEQMHIRYSGKWHKSFTFTQTTQQFRGDTVYKTSTWYEAIIFPDKFRIDIGEKKDSNAVIYLKDSVYSIRKGKLTGKRKDNDNLTFLLGGMYFYPLDIVKQKVTEKGYDLSRFHETTWKGKPTYVIGANNSTEKTNQLWIDQENFYIVKFVKYDGKSKEEGVFYNHKKFGNGWSETAVDFYVDDKLIQKEIYQECKANPEINEKIFDPYHFVH